MPTLGDAACMAVDSCGHQKPSSITWKWVDAQKQFYFTQYSLNQKKKKKKAQRDEWEAGELCAVLSKVPFNHLVFLR